MRVLVTGGAGFIGSHLVRALALRGAAVRVLDDFSSGSRERLASVARDIEILEGDIRDEAAAARATADVEAVFHLAAQVSVPRSVEAPAETADINVTGLATMLHAARAAGACRFVLASSCAVYGDGGEAVARSEDRPAHPASPYAASKLAGEAFVAAACRSGLPGLSLRYFNVYGPGQRPDSAYAAVVPAFRAALAAGRAPVLHGDGLQTRDFIHVSDVVRANLIALDAPAACLGRAFNVGTGQATTIMELALTLSGILRATVAPVHVEARAGDVRHSLASTALADQLLGFCAEVDLADGLRQLHE